MDRRLVLSMLLLLFCKVAVAQKYAVELQPDKKILYVETTGLPGETPLLALLRMFPELTVREGDEFLSGYDVYLDEKSIAYNKDVLLATMKLEEVEKIEISTSPTASQQVNGMAGSIKIFSRKLKDGFSGNASLNVSTLRSVVPNLNINFHKDKLDIRGNVGLQYFSGNLSSYFERDVYPEKDAGTNNFGEKYFQETVRLHLKYNPTKQDQLRIWVLEGYGYDKYNNIVDGIYAEHRPAAGKNMYFMSESSDTSYAKTSQLLFSAFAEYLHVFKDNLELKLTADYISGANKEGTLTLAGVNPEKPQTAKTEARFTMPFLPAGTRSLNMILGGNLEYNLNDREKIASRSLYASPFVELKYKSPALQVNTGFRFQRYSFDYDKSGQGLFSKGNDDITFNVNALWQIVEHHALRLIVTKNLIRPSLDKMYPVPEFDLTRGIYIMGNKDLLPSTMYSFDLDYISDLVFGRHSFVTNLSFGYDRAEGMVEMAQRYNEEYRKTYLTYVNSGLDDIFKAKANLIYKYGILSVSLAGNWYHRIKHSQEATDNIDSFNMAVSPVLSFSNNWIVSGTLRFNNAIISNDSRQGECLYSSIRVTKTVGRWSFSAMMSDIFGYTSENYEFKDGGSYYLMYDQYPRYFDIGVTYRIGH